MLDLLLWGFVAFVVLVVFSAFSGGTQKKSSDKQKPSALNEFIGNVQRCPNCGRKVTVSLSGFHCKKCSHSF